MSTKTKSASKKLTDRARQTGYILLAGAATLGMIDVPGHLRTRDIVTPNQPLFAFANDNNVSSEEQNNSVRRERDEVAPHYISYDEVQRTASRSGHV